MSDGHYKFENQPIEKIIALLKLDENKNVTISGHISIHAEPLETEAASNGSE